MPRHRLRQKLPCWHLHQRLRLRHNTGTQLRPQGKTRGPSLRWNFRTRVLHSLRRNTGTRGTWPCLGLHTPAAEILQHFLAKGFRSQLLQECRQPVPLSEPLNSSMVPATRKRPFPEIPVLSLGPTDLLDQGDEQNTKNTGTMLTSIAVQQHSMVSNQMHDHEVQDLSHALMPPSAVERTSLVYVQPTMHLRVLQRVLEVVLGAIHDRVGVIPCPIFGVLCLAHKKKAASCLAPDAPRHGAPEHRNTGAKA